MNAPESPANAQPQPQPIALSLLLRLLSSRELIFRVVIVLVIVISLSVAWWSFVKVLPPLQRQARELASTHASVSAEVDKLAREWSEARAAEVTNRYAQARSRLFSSEAGFAEWLANLNGRASSLTLDAKADFGKTTAVPAAGEKLATIPATIFLEARSTPELPATHSPYERVLELAQHLCTEEKRTDMTALTISGGTGSVSRASVVMNLWAGEEGSP